MKSKPGDSTLNKWWSQAVKKKYHGSCAVCEDQGDQAHHIIKRGNKVTKWCLWNGVYVCLGCHREITDKPAVAREVERRFGNAEMIDLWGRYNLSSWCAEHGMTKNEFRADRLKELKAYVDG